MFWSDPVQSARFVLVPGFSSELPRRSKRFPVSSHFPVGVTVWYNLDWYKKRGTGSELSLWVPVRVWPIRTLHIWRFEAGCANSEPIFKQKLQTFVTQIQKYNKVSFFPVWKYDCALRTFHWNPDKLKHDQTFKSSFRQRSKGINQRTTRRGSALDHLESSEADHVVPAWTQPRKKINQGVFYVLEEEVDRRDR